MNKRRRRKQIKTAMTKMFGPTKSTFTSYRGGKRTRSRKTHGNPAPKMKAVKKTTGWMNGPAGTNTQIKFKRNPGGKAEVYIRKKPARKRVPAKRKTAARKKRR